MRWALLEFTHYPGDDAVFDTYAPEDWHIIPADSLTDAVAIAAAIQGQPLARIDDSDSPYGGVFTNARMARRYTLLQDSVRSNTLCYAIFAESVFALPFDRTTAC
jgi:hypothetical protein